ncbi:hypothetical protein SUGI_0598010 [Cryptomeria japonica]|nr:hypothetical protein SUGI_0598010 [Cryptomeria japonica]
MVVKEMLLVLIFYLVQDKFCKIVTTIKHPNFAVHKLRYINALYISIENNYNGKLYCIQGDCFIDINGVSQRFYSLTEVEKTLVKDEMGLPYGSYMLQHHQKTLLEAWPMLYATVLYPAQEPYSDSNELMRTAIVSFSVPFMKTLLNSYDVFDGVDSLVNVGGNSEFCLHQIIQKHHHQKTLLEAWPILYAVVLYPAQEPYSDSNELMRTTIESFYVPFMKTLLNSDDVFDGVDSLVNVGGNSEFCLHQIIQKQHHQKTLLEAWPMLYAAVVYLAQEPYSDSNDIMKTAQKVFMFLL